MPPPLLTMLQPFLWQTMWPSIDTTITVGILTRINGMCAIRREQQQASLYECTSSTAAKLLLPLVNVCETSAKNTPDMETPDISKIMVSSSINLAVIYKSESQLWLKRIYRRLAGKTNIRRPYYSEIQRDMPVEMFLSLCRLLCNFPEFREPYFYNVGNKKAKVISFTHLPLVKYFLSRLSGKSVEEVAEYFERTLCAQRKGHITKVIVSPVKDFSLVYNFRKGQLTVSYNYGEWNSFGFPQHNCLL